VIELSNSDAIANQCQELATLVMRHTEGNGVHPTAIARLSFARSDTMSTATYSVGEHYLAIIVQGNIWFFQLLYRSVEVWLRQPLTSHV
jgi:hypothetical protein